MNERIKAGAEIHAGDGGYSIGTQEKYDEFVKARNREPYDEFVKARNREPDRIMELVRESHLDVYALGKDHEKWEATVKKFAELIVRECLAIAKNREDELENANLLKESNAVGIVAYRIARQFGVKE